MKPDTKSDLLYFKGLDIVPLSEYKKEPLRSKIEEYNAEFTALYNK